MKRKLLISMPVPELEPWDLPDYGETIKRYVGGNYTKKYANYVYTARIDDSTGEQVLILDLYRPSGKHLFRLFQDKETNFFRRLDDGKISEAGLDHTVYDESESGIWYHWDSRNFHASPETEETIFSFIGYGLQGDKCAFDALRICHRHAKEERLKDRYRKIKEADDMEMIEIRELPKSVINWIDSTLLKYSRYLFYAYTSKKTTSGYCTRCKKWEEIKTPKNRQRGKCHSCGQTVEFKPLGQFQRTYGFTDKAEFIYLQKTKNGFCAREYEVSRKYSNKNDPFTPVSFEDRVFETRRAFFRWDEARKAFREGSNFIYEEFRQSGEVRFCREPWYGRLSSRIYPGNLDDILKHEGDDWFLSYREIAKNCYPVNLENLIERPKEDRCILSLVQAGLYRMASDCINAYSDERAWSESGSLRKVFRIGKDDIPVLKKLDINLEEFRLWKEVTEKERTVDPEEFGELVRMVGVSRDIKKAMKLATVHGILRYLKEQNPEKPGGRGYRTCAYHQLSDWIDYMDNAALLGMNLKDPSVKFPKNLKKAHDEAYEAVRAAEKGKNGLQIAKIARMEEGLNARFYFETKKYLIRAPHDHRELIREGEKLHHCVATYAKSIAREESYILFIRDKEAPEDPLFTLELNPDTLQVRQCRGLKNCGYGKDIEAFIRKWRAAKIETIRKTV